MKTECFTNYTSEDFIFDKDFRELVQNPDEADTLKNLIESFPDKRYEMNLAIKVIRGLRVEKFHQSQKRKEELWQQVITTPRKHVQWSFIRYAAAILLLIAVGSLVYVVDRNDFRSGLSAKMTDLTRRAAGNEDEVLLVLSNGRYVNVSSKESTVKYSADGSKISVNDSEIVNQQIKNCTFNKVIVPYGKRSIITLSDGTKIWLNSGSTLIFPPVFTGKSRNVQLIGEGFFDVTHNKERPFNVKTDAFNMKVYGTKFDIQSYKQDNASSVILVEGKVSMKSNDDISKEVFLSPNQRATVVDGSSRIDIDEIENTEEYISWTEGYLSFSDEDITHLLKRVSRYYNVDIDVTSIKKGDKIFGKLDLKDDIEKVLDGISFISNTKYKKVGTKYEFYQ